MSFKKKSKQMTFADLESVENNSFTNIRLKLLVEIDNSIDWCSIKKIFDSTYDEGKNKLGQPAYPPLMLFKCLLLQKWFRIDSDPELESQINDSRAFRKFLNLPSNIPSSNHSTFSSFRGRLSKGPFKTITLNIFKQLFTCFFELNKYACTRCSALIN